MATYVLVHGAWHGGWCWRDVRKILESKGHTVFTPTLTGLGERSHLLSPAVDVDTHINDVLNVMAWEELDNVILVGHSYGGMVITGVADRAKDRLRHVVYLDAFVPDDGESTISHRMRYEDPRPTVAEVEAEIARLREAADARGGSTDQRTDLFGIPEGTPEYDWVKRRLTPQPVGCQTRPVHLANGGSDGLARTYILCTGSLRRRAFVAHGETAKSSPDWRYREIDTGHDSMVTMPGETAALFLEVAGP